MAPNSSSALFQPSKLGRHTLEHGVVLAPLTRFRNVDYTPVKPMQVEYYAQRASRGGLLISEGILISPESSATRRAPGIWNYEQLEAWRKIVDAVHAKGAIFYAQLWHLGRAAGKPSWEYGGKTYRPVSASETSSEEGGPVSRALSIQEIQDLKADYARAALNAIKAGFDGVELHGANGYILNQFMAPKANLRTDAYGGSLENRLRLPLEAAKAVVDAIGADRVGYRISPFGSFGDVAIPRPLETFAPFVEELLKANPGLAYVHVVEPRIDGIFERQLGPDDSLEPLRNIIKRSPGGTRLMAAGGHTPESSIKQADDHGDLIAFGRLFIANPDLPERILQGWPLNKYDRSTFYTRDEKGYTDYPTYEHSAARL